MRSAIAPMATATSDGRPAARNGAGASKGWETPGGSGRASPVIEKKPIAATGITNGRIEIFIKSNPRTGEADIADCDIDVKM